MRTRRKLVNGKWVRVYRVGSGFGWAASVEHQNGRVIAQTAIYSSKESARRFGVQLAERTQ